MKEETKCYCGHTTYCDCGPETLEEAVELFFRKKDAKNCTLYKAAKFGAKWQQERSYSEEDLEEAFKVGFNVGYNDETSPSYLTFEQWFEQFKKK